MGLRLTDADSEEEDSAFATAMVSESLGACAEGRAAELVRRAAAYLHSQIECPGVWRYWSSTHPGFHAIPPDVDTTACASAALREAAVPRIGPPDNRHLLLDNRDRAGRVHTWLVMRPGARLRSRPAWQLARRRAAHPLQARMYWRATSAAPADVDGVVNANVLAYLGDGPHAGPIAAYLEGILRSRSEAACDKWYRSAFLLYLAIARCISAGVGALAASAPIIAQRIAAAGGSDGRIGEGPLDTGAAVRALVEMGHGEEMAGVVAAGVDYLHRTQCNDGSWPVEPVYYGGPARSPDVPMWGSREVTTGLAVGALARAGRR